MSLASLFGRVDDRLNPIVVKELRQAVQGRFVTAVLLIFLLVQLVVLGTYLILGEVGARSTDLEAEHGRITFTILQGILLFTCLLFLPAFTGIRLGAERSDTNVDLLFITTLRPRAIISGKLLAGLVLAILIFSACAPFMTFTYLLRGLDLASILLVLGIDFFVVIGTVQIGIFLGAIPGNRIVKALLGVLGLGILAFIFAMTLSGTIGLLLEAASTSLVEQVQFWALLTSLAAAGLTVIGLFFTWSVAMVSPPSANRALPSRVFLLLAVPATGLVFGLWNRVYPFPPNMLLMMWIIFVGILASLQIMIAINEREYWTPRVARTIPRNLLLRVPAFLLYSGSVGGLLYALLLFGLLWVGTVLILALAPAASVAAFVPPGLYAAPASWAGPVMTTLKIMTVIGLYIYAYGMTAVLVRRLGRRRVRVVDTWALMILVMAIGCAVPIMISFAVFKHEWPYGLFLSNPVAAAIAIGEGARFPDRAPVFLLFVGIWAVAVTVLSLNWFLRQLLRFRPYTGNPALAKMAPVLVTVAPTDSTRTAPTGVRSEG
jgi:hypothetical protein